MKIFCIGLNKTVTTSLHMALKALGFRSRHWGGPDSRRAVERAIREGAPLLRYLGDYDAFSDIQRLSVNFDVLDQQYPGSRFILNTRDLDDWLDSRRRHVERNIRRKTEGKYDGTFLNVDFDAWRDLYLGHHERVRRYFADRPDDLLVMDISAGDGYERLCPFLGIKLPSRPFPWRHKDETVSG